MAVNLVYLGDGVAADLGPGEDGMVGGYSKARSDETRNTGEEKSLEATERAVTRENVGAALQRTDGGDTHVAAPTSAKTEGPPNINPAIPEKLMAFAGENIDFGIALHNLAMKGVCILDARRKPAEISSLEAALEANGAIFHKSILIDSIKKEKSIATVIAGKPTKPGDRTVQFRSPVILVTPSAGEQTRSTGGFTPYAVKIYDLPDLHTSK